MRYIIIMVKQKKRVKQCTQYKKKKGLSNEMCEFGTNPMNSVSWKKILEWATLNLPLIVLFYFFNHYI